MFAIPSSLALSTGVTTLIVVALLLALAVVMIAVAVWLIRRTRRDVPALGPLEVMADRSWRKGAADRRAELLDRARPEGARGPAPMLDIEPEADPSSEPTTEPSDADATEVTVLHRYDPSDG